MKYMRFALAVGLGLLLLTSCIKSGTGTGLPEATQKGANTFGFLLNDNVWIPKGSVSGASRLFMEYDPTLDGIGYLRISAYNLKDTETFKGNSYFDLYVSPIDGLGMYEADPSDGFPGAQYTNIIADESMCAYRNGVIDGFVNITKLDTEARIISGTFEFTLTATDCYPEEQNCPACEDIKITDGRFDMSY